MHVTDCLFDFFLSLFLLGVLAHFQRGVSVVSGVCSADHQTEFESGSAHLSLKLRFRYPTSETSPHQRSPAMDAIIQRWH